MQSTTKKPLTRDLVASARETLEAIPPAPEEMLEVSVTEAIQLLMPTLQRLFKKGYKRPKVVEFLREQGIECSEATLKTLYRSPKSRKDKASKANDGAAPNRTPDAGDGGGPAAFCSAERQQRRCGPPEGLLNGAPVENESSLLDGRTRFTKSSRRRGRSHG
jgi:hypothetical protein